MISIRSFEFSPFQENTYVLYDSSKECVIIDPGCYDNTEKQELLSFIKDNELKPVKLLNTHCHVDHIFGNAFVAQSFGLKLEAHQKDLYNIEMQERVCQMYGLNYEASPQPSVFLNEGDIVRFGQSELEILFTPGHSAGSICFYSPKQRFMIAGDVLFYGSIGRTDLPGGDHPTLIKSINQKLLVLNDDYIVYPGHGPATTIGYERVNNPFLS